MARTEQPVNRFAELEEYRLSQDWTYHDLSEAIARITNRRRAVDCWRRICKGLVPQPHERTVDIIESFLAQVRRTAGKSRRRVA